jgi:diguanylate cyclase (GGDEF)-like protein/PAS domain S-box-containing protein
MPYRFVAYTWVGVVLLPILGALMVYTWRNLAVKGARWLLLTLVLLQIWVFAQAMEMMALQLPAKLIWANIQYIPITLAPVTILNLSVEYVERTHRELMRKINPFLLLMPIALNFLIWTDTRHGLIRTDVFLDTRGAFPTVGKTFGPLFYYFAVYNHLLSLAIIVLLAFSLKGKLDIRRRQIMLLLLALVPPVFTTLLQVTGLNPFRVDMTPAMFGLSALCIAWSVFRYGLFDVVPVARSIIIKKMKTGMIVLDPGGRILEINPAAAEMLELSPFDDIGRFAQDELIGLPDIMKICIEGKDTIREMVFTGESTNKTYEVTITHLRDVTDKSVGCLLQIYDMTDRKLAEEIIRHAALHDSLTGLPNRNYFQILFIQEIALAKNSKKSFAIAYIDLDDFKNVNDQHGHDVGDKVLCEVVERLRGALYTTDIISRIGGDEFTVLLPQIGSDEAIAPVGDKLVGLFEEEFRFRFATYKSAQVWGFPSIRAMATRLKCC